MIQGVAKVNATTYDFYPFMTQAGRYQCNPEGYGGTGLHNQR